jgi:hypothetical protein
MQKLELTGHIDDSGQIAIHHRPALEEWARQNPGRNILVKFEKRGSKRSTPQCRYYFGVVVQSVMQGFREIGYHMSKDETHLWLKQKFNPIQIPNKHGEAIELPGTTTQLNKVEFSEYIERIAQFASEYLGVVIPPANSDLKMQF